MASLVVRAAAAAAARLPTFRPRRNGSGVLTGLRVGAEHYGVRLALSSSAASPKEFKVACLPVDDSSLGPGDDYVSDPMDEDEFDHFYRHLAMRAAVHMHMLHASYPEPKPLAASEEEKAVQEKFKEIANECIDLLVGAMRRIPAEKRRPLTMVFAYVYPVFASVRWYAERGGANWWMALQIIEALEIVRKMVSSACDGTPLDRHTVSVFNRTVFDTFPLTSPSMVAIELIVHVYSIVKSDIDDMLSASSTPY